MIARCWPLLDTVGVHAKDFDVMVAMTGVICGREFAGGRTGSIHVLDYAGNVEVETDVDAAFQAFVAGRDYPRTRLAPYGFGASRRQGLILSEVEGFAVHAETLAREPDGFSDFFRGMLEYGRDLPLEKIERAYAHVHSLRRADFPDFVLMPTAPQTAFRFGDLVPANQADFTAFANLADRPAIQFPIGVNGEGLPIGAQLIGPRGREADLVATVRDLIN
jgi:aspartyl-tRNA(Asn)/glutamyl-tRNA(Gln) amidotransferase subunit A